MHFAGVDLGWKVDPPRKNGTGFCTVGPDGRVIDLQLLTDDTEILERLARYDRVWVGIDAPLMVPNNRGVRRCERLLLDRGIRLLPANREFMIRRFGECRGERLVLLLESSGFSLAPTSSPNKVFEVYPFGMLSVIMRGKVPSYKRGSADRRREEAISVLEAAARWADLPTPEGLREEILEVPHSGLRSLMDKLDAFLSVLCVYAHWLYGGNITRMIGGGEDGYILLPESEV